MTNPENDSSIVNTSPDLVDGATSREEGGEQRKDRGPRRFNKFNNKSRPGKLIKTSVIQEDPRMKIQRHLLQFLLN